MLLLIENIKLAITAIKTNKMRSFLTMLGIIIGISSVIAISSIGASAKGAVSEEFEGIGKGYLYIMTNWEKFEYLVEDDFFSIDDIEALRERFSEDILYAAPYRYISAGTKAGRDDLSLALYGVGANYSDFAKSVVMVSGRMINENDIEKNRSNMVIDIRCAEKVFGTSDVVGKSIEIFCNDEYKDFNIIGVYETPTTIFSALDMGQTTYTCYVPHEQAVYYTGEPSNYIELYVDPNKDVDVLATQFCRYLEKIKGKEEESYRYSSSEEQLAEINSLVGILSIAIGAIAAISLLVGGIGIMNIMLVSVTERTREIGIRKSLGARTKDIMTQFLIESVILSVIGGTIGMLLGIGIAAIGMAIANVNLVISPVAVMGAVLFSAAVGLFFGIFPAKKAAKLDPIEALRYE